MCGTLFIFAYIYINTNISIKRILTQISILTFIFKTSVDLVTYSMYHIGIPSSYITAFIYDDLSKSPYEYINFIFLLLISFSLVNTLRSSKFISESFDISNTLK